MKKIIKKIFNGINVVISIFLNRLCIFLFPLQKNKVCFLSDVRSVMGGNLECIYEYLDCSKYKKIVALKSDHRERRGLISKFKLIYHLSTSQYILLDDLSRECNYLQVRKNQEVVQLWHGAGAFKKFGWSRANTGEDVGPIHKGYRTYTKAIVSSEDIRSCYAEAFHMDVSKIKATGFPRTDMFFDDQYKEDVKNSFYQRHPRYQGKKIILFAPTYRGAPVSKANYDFSKIDFQKIYETFHEDYIFIIKWHPALYNNIQRGIVEMPDLTQYNHFYRDFSNNRDINDLLIISDILITDYSSVVFDYYFTHKPIIYFTYDLDEYTGYGGRGLYFDFYEYVYGAITTNTDELIQALQNKDMNESQRQAFYQRFLSACDGHSTQKTCEWIFKDS